MKDWIQAAVKKLVLCTVAVLHSPDRWIKRFQPCPLSFFISAEWGLSSFTLSSQRIIVFTYHWFRCLFHFLIVVCVTYCVWVLETIKDCLKVKDLLFPPLLASVFFCCQVCHLANLPEPRLMVMTVWNQCSSLRDCWRADWGWDDG